ncbi:hypothetical protein Dip510_000610 [Elusimicrobium posterum]|uniref:hypothetical protein n=1 Tax=Elusimicrobium posterum TaxID=3116653 RepID=UPI003C72CE0D
MSDSAAYLAFFGIPMLLVFFFSLLPGAVFGVYLWKKKSFNVGKLLFPLIFTPPQIALLFFLVVLIYLGGLSYNWYIVSFLTLSIFKSLIYSLVFKEKIYNIILIFLAFDMAVMAMVFYSELMKILVRVLTGF